VIGHVEGGQSGVGVTEHGFDGVISVDSTPTAAGLPHPVQHSAYLQRIVPVTHRHSPILARGRAHVSAPN